jgi:predicted ester cyclase
MPTPEIRAAREKVVLDHFHDEVAQDWDRTLSTFPHPHYELIPMLLVHDGDRDVRDYYRDTRVAFPDQDHEIIALRHSHDAVVVEFWLTGTHLGPLGRMPPTGSAHRTRMTAYFVFDEDENLVAERIYFDQLSILKQLVAGLDKRRPSDLLTLGRVVAGALGMASGDPDPRLTETTPPDLG